MTSKKRKTRYYFSFAAHLAIIIGAYLSPFLLDWKLVILGALIYIVFSHLLKYCVLTKYQLGHTDHSFNWYYLNKLGINVSEKKLNIYLKYIMPLVVVAVAILWQAILSNEVILSL